MKYKILLAIFILCLISSIILSIPSKSLHKFCTTDLESNCNSVQNSKYAYTLGIKNSYLGIIIFTFLSILTISQIKKPKKNKKTLIATGIIIGSIISIYFLYLQIFVIKEFCRYCLIIDFGLLISLLLIIPWKRKS